MQKFIVIVALLALFIVPARAEDLKSDMSALQAKAEKGDAQAQFDLGLRYAMGRGTGIDYKQATDWFRKAADQGLATAQFNLGVSYDLGRGVKQDYAEAMTWYKKAADQGFQQAENNIGDLYEHGQGVKQDYAEAARWYKKSIDGGGRVAQSSLGMLYFAGSGVKQDYAEAFFWLTLGTQDMSGYEDAEVAGIKHALEECAKHLKPDEVKAIRKRVSEWKQPEEKLAPVK